MAVSVQMCDESNNGVRVLPHFLKSDVLISAECAHVIDTAESHGFMNKRGNVMFAGNRERAAYMDQRLADVLWERLRHDLQPVTYDSAVDEYHSTSNYEPTTGRYVPVGINPFMRVSRYVPGGDFRWHTDTVYSNGPKSVGFQTLLLYLNDDFVGGETELQVQASHEDELQIESIRPSPGRVLVFDHTQVHQGCLVEDGVKIVLRTEVAFRRA